MKALIGVILVSLAVPAFATDLPAEGMYKVESGGLVSSTCQSVDRTSLDQLPYWVVRSVGADSVNLRQAPNPYASEPAHELFGFFPLKGRFGLYTGSGWTSRNLVGPIGICHIRRDISAKLNAFADGGLLLQATVKESFLNPSYEAPACLQYEQNPCEYSFSYSLTKVD